MKRLNPMTSATLLLVGASAIMLAGCDVDQTREGELPEVTAEGGQLPQYEVETADVDIGTREETVTVPDVDITMPDEQQADEADENETPRQ